MTDAIKKLGPNERLDGIVVCTPTFTHGEIIQECAENGLDVFIEKPVDETAEKVKKFFAVANDANIRICCGFQRRFDPSYKSAAEAVQNGVVGHPVMASIFFADHPVPPKEFLLKGGNIFMDLAAHDVDFIMNTLQDKVVSVYASGTSSDDDLAAVGVHDNATMVMNFSKGKSSSIKVYIQKTCSVTFSIIFTYL